MPFPRRLAAFCLSLLLLAACSSVPTNQYGVTDEAWGRMSEAERIEVIRGYNERERIREQARLQDAERRAAEARAKAEREQAEKERMERERNNGRDAPNRRGDARQWGDLIRVDIQGGEMRLGGRHRSYAPIAVSLRDGERREVEVVSDDGRLVTYRGELRMSYLDGRLVLDNAALQMEPDWRFGRRYRVDSNGALDLRDVEVKVIIVPSAGPRR